MSPDLFGQLFCDKDDAANSRNFGLALREINLVTAKVATPIIRQLIRRQATNKNQLSQLKKMCW